jgi:hypothetical protein
MQSGNKHYLLRHIQQTLEDKLAAFQADAMDLKSSLENESKSSAGDKHNTSRAMIHIEQEKLGEQIGQTQQQLQKIQQIMNSNTSELIGFGSFVKTDAANFILGLSLGRIKIDEQLIFGISMESPIGQQLLNKKQGDLFSFMQKEVEIKEVS